MAKKSGLGRGLGSLLGEAVVEAGTAPDTMLPIDLIERNPHQPRRSFDEAALQELADSIAEHGILQPILVRAKGDGYEIVAGERRYQAARRAGLTEVPVLVREVSDEESFQLALVENLQRADLNPIEEALGYRTLIQEQGLTQTELARIVSKSRSAVTNTLRLLDLPEAVQELMADGKLSAGHARAILAVPDPEARERLAQKVVAEGLSVRATERLAPLFSVAEQPKPTRPAAPASYRRAAQLLRDSLGTSVRVKQVRGKNKIEISFTDEEDLARIMGLLSDNKEQS